MFLEKYIYRLLSANRDTLPGVPNWKKILKNNLKPVLGGL